MTRWLPDTCNCIFKIYNNNNDIVIINEQLCKLHSTYQQALDYNHTFTLTSNNQNDKTKLAKNLLDKRNAKDKT